MSNKKRNDSVSSILILLFVVASVLILRSGYISGKNSYWGLFITVPFLLIHTVDVRKVKQALLRHFRSMVHLLHFEKVKGRTT